MFFRARCAPVQPHANVGLRRDEPNPLRRVRLEHAVDHDDMNAGVFVQRGTEPLNEGHGPGACRDTGTQAVARVLLDRIERNAQGSIERFLVVLESCNRDPTPGQARQRSSTVRASSGE